MTGQAREEEEDPRCVGVFKAQLWYCMRKRGERTTTNVAIFSRRFQLVGATVFCAILEILYAMLPRMLEFR